MYAIIKTGGKQYRVEKDTVIDIERLSTDSGTTIEFTEVLFVNDGSQSLVGSPYVENFLVKGEVVGDSVGPKVVSLKYRPRQHKQKKWGHRQKYERVKITEIGNLTKTPSKAAKGKQAQTEQPKEEVHTKQEENQ